MMLDWLLPEFDATIVEHRVIDADPASVYRGVTTVDLAEIPQAYPAVRVLFAARGAAERLVTPSSAGPHPPSSRTGRCGSATCPRTASGSSSPTTRRGSSPSA